MIFTYRTRAYSTDCWTGNAFQLRTRYLLVFAGLCILFFLVSWSLSIALSLAWLHWPFVHRCGLCQITESHTYVRCVRGARSTWKCKCRANITTSTMFRHCVCCCMPCSHDCDGYDIINNQSFEMTYRPHRVSWKLMLTTYTMWADSTKLPALLFLSIIKFFNFKYINCRALYHNVELTNEQLVAVSNLSQIQIRFGEIGYLTLINRKKIYSAHTIAVDDYSVFLKAPSWPSPETG